MTLFVFTGIFCIIMFLFGIYLFNQTPSEGTGFFTFMLFGILFGGHFLFGMVAPYRHYVVDYPNEIERTEDSFISFFSDGNVLVESSYKFVAHYEAEEMKVVEYKSKSRYGAPVRTFKAIIPKTHTLDEDGIVVLE